MNATLAIRGHRVSSRTDDRFSALGTWFAAEHAGLYRFALVICQDPAVAEDLVQETFIRMSLAGADPTRIGVGAYARRTLVNLDNSRLRRWYRERRAVQRLAARTPDRVEPPEPSDPALLAALATLPTMQRAVVALRFLEDRSESETATILGIAPGTAKSHASRALHALRATLEVNHDG